MKKKQDPKKEILKHKLNVAKTDSLHRELARKQDSAYYSSVNKVMKEVKKNKNHTVGFSNKADSLKYERLKKEYGSKKKKK